MRQNERMSTTFPRVRRSELGYDIEQVEDFLWSVFMLPEFHYIN